MVLDNNDKAQGLQRSTRYADYVQILFESASGGYAMDNISNSGVSKKYETKQTINLNQLSNPDRQFRAGSVKGLLELEYLAHAH
jgi:hypothetical protein